MTLTVRRIRLDDAALLRDVRLRALASDPLSFGSTLAREQAFDDAVWQQRAREQSAGPDACTLLAFVDDAAAGMVVGRRAADRPDAFHVYGMWVAPEARRHGAGRALLGALEDWMRAGGGRIAELEVTDRAAAARALYESLGYAATGASTPSTAHAGVVERCLRKDLRTP